MSIASNDTSSEPLFILSQVRAAGAAGVITVGATKSETIVMPNTVTSHPVEVGSDMTDHVRPEPIMISAECWISNSPISVSDQQLAAQQGGGQLSVAPAGNIQIEEVPGYALSVLDQLKTMRKQATLVTVICSKGRFPSMVIEDISIADDVTTFNALRFSIKFKEIVVVQLSTAIVSTDVRVRKRNDKGNTTPTAAPKPVEKSLADRAGHYVNSKIFGGQ